MTQAMMNKLVARAMDFDIQGVTLNLDTGCMEIKNICWIAILVKTKKSKINWANLTTYKKSAIF